MKFLNKVPKGIPLLKEILNELDNFEKENYKYNKNKLDENRNKIKIIVERDFPQHKKELGLYTSKSCFIPHNITQYEIEREDQQDYLNDIKVIKKTINKILFEYQNYGKIKNKTKVEDRIKVESNFFNGLKLSYEKVIKKGKN